MLYVLCGENEFDKRQKLAALIAGGAVPERYDGEQLDAASLRDIMQGQSLFTLERTVIISRMSDNSALWAELPEIAVSGSTEMIPTLSSTRAMGWAWPPARAFRCKTWSSGNSS